MRKLLISLFVLAPSVSSALEKLALVDSYDFAKAVDIETESGSARIVDHVMRTGCDTILWRNQSGSLPRYASKEDSVVRASYSLDDRRVARNDIWGWTDLARTELVRSACRYCATNGMRNVGFGIHLTFEENHWDNWTFGTWNLDHPQFWCSKKGGNPWAGRASLAYDEVLEHKLRLLDEIVDLGATTVFLDLFRAGGWSVRFEYVKPMIQAWRKEYGCEPPDDAEDERWLRLAAKPMNRYLRALSARCRARGVRFLIGLTKMSVDESYIWRTYALDWKALAAEGVFDGVVVTEVVVDGNDAKGAVERTYRWVAANCGRADFYASVSQYSYQYGYVRYAKDRGISEVEAVRELLQLAEKSSAKGVILECVDWNNYSDGVCDVLNEKKAR